MIKVLIVDDSVLFSTVLKDRLSECDKIEVVGVASNPYEARDKILELEPDIMTLDIEMPRMDGVKFLKKLLPQYPIPVIMISSLEGRKGEAFDAGARGFCVKPSLSDSGAVNFFIKKVTNEILRICGKNIESEKCSAVTHTDLPHYKKPSVSPQITGGRYSRNGIETIALGASTGGTDALETVIKNFPADCPPIVVTQHMPPVFTKMYAERLNKNCQVAVFEAKDGMRLGKGMCVVAEGGKQMELMRDSQGYYIKSR